MSFFWLAVKDLLLTCRDKKAFLTLIAMPLLLIAILGAAFGNVFQEEEGNVTIEKFTLGIVNEDVGELGKVLSDDVFAKALSEQVRVKNLDEKDLKEQIETRKLKVGIVIPSDFSETVLAGKEADIKLISIPNPGIKATIVQSVLEQFTQSVAVEAELTKIATEQALKSGMTLEQFQASKSSGKQQAVDKEEYEKLIAEKTVKADSNPVGAFQYYAAAMGVMFLLITVTDGVSAMIQEKEQEVYKRLLVSKLSFANYLTGKMLGLIVISLIQSFVIILGTTLLFDVAWGDSLLGIITNTVAFVISACGLGVLVGSFIKKEKTFSVAAMLGTQIMAALGGSMAPLYIFPDWAVWAGKMLPNGLALQTYLDLMSGASFLEILPEASVSLGLGLVFFTLGLIRLSIERRGSYA
ncbi:ABC transporter permease [Bacillus sp. DNRA2]|uniref:ABC transporter permease n=1 Tax=Bacillus sp. DNRA2 TaxID=2723053 RepID=UPI00145DA638|nr:ABC transporter permease [Bacillus sp. DNRA2]NMD70823.1 ABC transporter permease [Bacillus sp. DNRA2]